MKIVIDISEDMYKKCQTSEYAKKSIYFDLVDVIRNGTPFPKGHGVLKDVTNLMRGLYTDIQARAEETFTSSDVYKMIDEECPTIIEADKPKKKAGIPLEENDSGYNCENWIP